MSLWHSAVPSANAADLGGRRRPVNTGRGEYFTRAAVWLAVAWLGLAGAATATTCRGTDLIAAMPEADRAALRAEAEAVPHSRGLVWRAGKGAAHMLIAGTYHLDDPRHAALADSLAPELADAAALLVEAGPEEQARLQAAMAADPTLVIDPEGAPLSDRLDEADWTALKAALAERGIPAPMAARMRPWYASVMLGIAPCAMRDMAQGGGQGLDQRLIAEAGARALPIRALEPWDTLFTMFADLTPQEETDLLRTALAGASQADDLAVTTANAYFDGRAWEIWLLTRYLSDDSGLTAGELDAQMAMTQAVLLDARNSAWLPQMTEAAEAAAGDGKGIVVAVGLLHLPGPAGLLSRLEAEGWAVERLE